MVVRKVAASASASRFVARRPASLPRRPAARALCALTAANANTAAASRSAATCDGVAVATETEAVGESSEEGEAGEEGRRDAAKALVRDAAVVGAVSWEATSGGASVAAVSSAPRRPEPTLKGFERSKVATSAAHRAVSDA